jgi:hypothetical protein
MKKTLFNDRIAFTILINVMLAAVMLFTSCLPKRYALDLDVPGFHQFIRLKFKLKNDNDKQHGKILMAFDVLRAKILFLSPLNQVYFQLLVEKDRSFLINTRKKKYWLGDFNELIRKMWAIDLNFDDLKRLIQRGTIPEQILADAGLQLNLETSRDTGTPERIILRGDRVELELKILNQRRKKGAVQFYRETSRFDRSGLDQVLVYD